MIEPSVVAASECFLCRKKSGTVVWRENGLDARLCDCGMVYTDTGGRAFGEVGEAMEVHPDSFYARPARFKANWLARRCPKGKLLEVGCGEPSFLRAARELGYEISALDAHEGRARRVSDQLGIPVECAFLEADTLQAGTFDVVYHYDMLAHFPDPVGALRSMTRLLRPSGVLCFEAGTLGGISAFWYRRIRVLALGPHLHLYSARSLDVLMKRARLEVLHRTSFGLAPEVLTLLPRAMLKKLIPSQAFEEWTYHFIRYHIGRVAPMAGPGTFLYVVRPEGGA